MSSLYADITHLKQAIDGLIAQCPELADDEILRADMVEGQTEISHVFSTILKSIREDEIAMEGIEKILLDLETRIGRARNRNEAKRNLLTSLMGRADLTKFVLPEATLSMSWRPPSPIVVDETQLPDDCVKQIRKADMAAIKARVEAGEMPPGVSMSNGQNVLTIRVK